MTILLVLKTDARAKKLADPMRRVASSLIWNTTPGPIKAARITDFLDAYNGRNGIAQLDQLICHVLANEVQPHLNTDQLPFCAQVITALTNPASEIPDTTIQELITKRRLANAEYQLHKTDKRSTAGLYIALRGWGCLLDAWLRADPESANGFLYAASAILTADARRSAHMRLSARSAGQSINPHARQKEVLRVEKTTHEEFFLRCWDRLLTLAAQ